MEINNETKKESKKSLKTWLFNPFYYIAGGKALVFGIIIILATGIIGFFSNSHFDGVLDFHTGHIAPFWFFLSEGLIDWLVMGVLLFIAGFIISRTRIRIIDIFGTQSLVRFPMFVTSLAALLPGYKNFLNQLASNPTNIMDIASKNTNDFIMFLIVIFITLFMLIWMITLMYRAFSISCNVVGGKAISTFIIILLIGESLSKIILGTIAKSIF